jgi:hypothetical protein
MEPELCLFASFDLSNFTMFKNNHPNWAKVFHCFYKNITDQFKDMEYWKVNGDEVLFYKTISDKKEIKLILDAIEHKLVDFINFIYSSFNKKCKEDYIEDIKQLSIKSTLWLATIVDEANAKDKCGCKSNILNIKFHTKDGGTDFVGKDIDIGFRISKHVPRAKIGISANLAYVLLEIDEEYYRNVLFLASYELLKGVWNNKRYPIFIYLRKENRCNFISSFHYDEKFDNPIVKKMIEQYEKNNNQFKPINTRDFREIFEYLGIHNDIDLIKTKLHLT